MQDSNCKQNSERGNHRQQTGTGTGSGG